MPLRQWECTTAEAHFLPLAPTLRAGTEGNGTGWQKVTLGDIFRKLFTTPSIWAYILMVVFSIVHWQPPACDGCDLHGGFCKRLFGNALCGHSV